MLFQLHQYTKKVLQQWRQSNKFLLICYNAHLQIDVHFSTHLKNNNNFLFKPLIKIIQVLFFFSLFYSKPHRAQALIISSSLISSHLSHQALISLLSPCLSLSFTLIFISQLWSEAHRQRCLRRPQRHRPKPQSTPLLIRPTPTLSSPSHKPPSPPISLFSLL